MAVEEKRRDKIIKSYGSIKNIQISAINIILKDILRGVANIDREEADNIKYITCLKLKYPPNIFSSRFISNGTLNILINVAS